MCCCRQYLHSLYILAGILLEDLLQLHLSILKLQLLTLRKNYGQNFHLKEANTLLHTNPLISDGRITVPWFSGQSLVYQLFHDCNLVGSQSAISCFVFRTLRKLFKVDPADYMLSICGNDALRELSSPGKSGSFFYLTNDDRYMIKTIKKAEAKVSITTTFFCSLSTNHLVYMNETHNHHYTGASKDAFSLL